MATYLLAAAFETKELPVAGLDSLPTRVDVSVWTGKRTVVSIGLYNNYLFSAHPLKYTLQTYS